MADLLRYYGGSDNLYTADARIQSNAINRGYSLEGSVGQVYMDELPGTLPLYRYYDEDRGDNALAALPERIKAYEACGYTRMELVGYVYPEKTGNSHPLYELRVWEGNMFYTSRPDEFNDLVGTQPDRYAGICCYLPGEGPGGEAKAPEAISEAPRIEDRAPAIDDPALLAWSGASRIRQNDFFQYWGKQRRTLATLKTGVMKEGKESLHLKLSGESPAGNIIAFQYEGLEPGAPVQVSFSWLADFSRADTYNTLLRLWVGEGWKTPYIYAWYNGNCIVRSIDSENRWEGNATGGWQAIDLVPVRADHEGRATIAFEFQNWNNSGGLPRDAWIADLSVRTAPDPSRYAPRLREPSFDTWNRELIGPQAHVRIVAQPFPFDAEVSARQEVRYTLDGSPPGPTSPIAGNEPIILGPGVYGIKAAAFARGCETSNIAEMHYVVEDPDNPSPELILNGAFTSGMAFWRIWLNQDSKTAKGLSYSTKDGVLTIGTVDGGEGFWTVVAVAKKQLHVKQGELYTLSFTACADAERDIFFSISENGIDADGDGSIWSSHFEKVFKLGTSPAAYTASFFIKGRPDGQREPLVENTRAEAWIMLGGSSVPVHLSKISLTRVTDEAEIERARSAAGGAER
jgi:hypothetical protein